jgi:tryptophan-rich sensory protein
LNPGSQSRTEASGAHPRRWLWLAFWLAMCLGVGFAGSLLTAPKIPTWYAGLTKPSFNPPNWIFAPVWTFLYVTMAVAVWRVATGPADTDMRRRAVLTFSGQLGLNAIWSPAFFGLESPLLALFIILALLSALVLTVAVFLRIDRIAGILLLPYLAWVAFAAVLNAAIVVLN